MLPQENQFSGASLAADMRYCIFGEGERAIEALGAERTPSPSTSRKNYRTEKGKSPHLGPAVVPLVIQLFWLGWFPY